MQKEITGLCCASAIIPAASEVVLAASEVVRAKEAPTSF